MLQKIEHLTRCLILLLIIDLIGWIYLDLKIDRLQTHQTIQDSIIQTHTDFILHDTAADLQNNLGFENHITGPKIVVENCSGITLHFPTDWPENYDSVVCRYNKIKWYPKADSPTRHTIYLEPFDGNLTDTSIKHPIGHDAMNPWSAKDSTYTPKKPHITYSSVKVEGWKGDTPHPLPISREYVMNPAAYGGPNPPIAKVDLNHQYLLPRKYPHFYDQSYTYKVKGSQRVGLLKPSGDGIYTYTLDSIVIELGYIYIFFPAPWLNTPGVKGHQSWRIRITDTTQKELPDDWRVRLNSLDGPAVKTFPKLITNPYWRICNYSDTPFINFDPFIRYQMGGFGGSGGELLSRVLDRIPEDSMKAWIGKKSWDSIQYAEQH